LLQFAGGQIAHSPVRYDSLSGTLAHIAERGNATTNTR